MGDTDVGGTGGTNVTVDPLSWAVPVDDPEIVEILNCRTGEFREVKSWISSWRYEQLIRHRVNIRESIAASPRFRCPLCGVPVYLVSNRHKRFFFKHQVEDGSCPAQTRDPLSRDDILARKYHGLRESEPHRRIKSLVARSLSADPRYSLPLIERQWLSSHDPSSRRQPDVQAVGPNGRLAFEVQLSTTFLDVVVARRAFYRDEGALLVWVMGEFEPGYRRLTTDDLLFSNNSNVLTVDEESASISESSRTFHVRCHFRRPVRDGEELIDVWETGLVPFDELTCDIDAQRCWHVDYEGEAEAIRAAIGGELRDRLLAFWLERYPERAPDEEQRHAWHSLSHSLAARGITLPSSPGDDSHFIAFMNGLASAREGRPVGWRFKQLVEVAHRIAEAYPQHAAAFGFATRHFGSNEIIASQDRTGKWRRRAHHIRDSLRSGGAEFLPDRGSLPLVDILVPEIATKLRRLLYGVQHD